jgi:hypothetical protein
MLSESFLPFFEWCGNTWLGTTVRDTVWAFPVIETFHLLALAVVLGTVLIVNLRVLGLGARFGAVSPMARELEPWLLTSLAISLVSGVLLFVSEPMKCYESISFPIKIALIAVAIPCHFKIQRKWATSEREQASFNSKLAAGATLALWTGIGLLGKGIPYV